jgi:DnaK suppressor protein
MKSKAKQDHPDTGEAAQFLRARHAELAESIRMLAAQYQHRNGGETAEDTSRAAETLDDEIRSALLDRRSRQIAQVEAAIEQLDRGEYGQCHDCGGFIGLARLRALPFAQRCAACQARAERRTSVTRRPAPARSGRRAA